MRKPLEKRYWTRTVLWDEIVETTPKKKKIYKTLCRCDCGVEKYVQRQHLLNWCSKNCWCLKQKRFSDLAKQYSTKHWMEWTIPYRKFMSAKARCENPNNDSYYRYWWRWIKMLRKNFEEFWQDMWDSYNEHIKTHWIKNTTLDRIDVNWHYCKENCRWATRLQQYNNMTNNHKVVYKWKSYPSISELCRQTWKKYQLVRDRIRYWWDVDEAIDLDLCKNSHDHNKIKREKADMIQSTSYPLQKSFW